MTSDYTTAAVKDFAVTRILDYYGLKSSTAVTGITDDLEAMNIYFPASNYANPILLMRSKLSLLTEHPPRTHWSGGSGTSGVQIRIKDIPTFKKHIQTAFTIYDQQLNYFGGSVTPKISFLSLSNKIKVFFENLTAFYQFNEVDIENGPWTDIGIYFDSGTDQIVKLTLWEFVAVDKDPADGTWAPRTELKVFAGFDYYFKELPASQNKYVNEIISNFDNIVVTRRDQTSWTKFIHQYLSNADIKIDYYGPPSTNTVANEVETMTKDSEGGEIGDTKESKNKLDAFLNDPAVVTRGFEEQRQRSKEQMENNLQKRLDKITSEMQEIGDQAELVSKFLKKWRLDALIEAALECLLFKMGYNGPMPEFIPGVDPLMPVPPRLKIRFPSINMRLPIININKQMQAQIENSLRVAALSALKGAIEGIAELIRELCLTEPADAPPGPPFQELAADWPNPVAFGPDGARRPEDCYKDYGLTTDEIGGFLIKLAQLITAREACDLMNGFPSAALLQIVNNVLNESEFSAARTQLADDATIQQFFVCMGNLVDVSYCEEVYKGGNTDLNSIDPCDIEDQLGDAFNDLISLLDGLEDLQPDMGPCGGIVPPLSSVASYNYSVISLLDTVLRPAQQTFITDLGNFKRIITVPDPFAPENSARARRIEELSRALTHADGDTSTAPGATSEMLQNLIPSQLSDAFGEFQKIKEKLDNLANLPAATNLASLQASLEWSVAPQTRAFYENMEASIGTSLLLRDGYLPVIAEGIDEEQYYQRYAFLTDIPTSRRGSAGYGGQGKIVVYDVSGASSGAGTAGDRDRVIIIDDANPTLPLDQGGSVNSLINGYLRGTQESDLSGREFEAQRFGALMTAKARDKHTHNWSSTSFDSLFIKKYFPFAYFSLVNLFGYQVSTSPLFNPDNLEKLNLFPKFCADNQVSDTDLLDVNKIKREAMEEFVDNACSDRTTELGPVRDAGIMGIVNAYLQVIVVDFILKNIFIVSEFGVDFFEGSSSIVNELFKQASSRRLLVGALLEIEHDYDIMPEVVKMGAALYVKKLLRRMTPAELTGFQYPITGDPDGEIAGFVGTGEGIATVPIDGESSSTKTLQNIALRYMFETRLLNCASTVNSYFNILGDNTLENVLIHGLSHVELPDLHAQMISLNDANLVPAADTAKIKYLYSSAPTQHDLDGDGSPDGQAKAVYMRILGLGGSGKHKFFGKLGYVDRGEDIFREATFRTLAGSNQSASGKELETAVAKADAEIESILTYGAVVLEKFVKLKVNMSALGRFITDLEQSSNPMLAAIAGDLTVAQDLLQELTPIGGAAPLGTFPPTGDCTDKPGTTYNSATGECECPPGFVWMPEIEGSGAGPWGGNTPAGCYPGTPAGAGLDDIGTLYPPAEYYVSFDTFKRIYNIFADIVRTGYSGWLPIPFSLRGQTSRQANDASKTSTAGIGKICGLNDEYIGDTDANEERRHQGLAIWLGGEAGTDSQGRVAYAKQWVREEEKKWGDGDDGSDRRALSDYCLIRNWVRKFQRRIMYLGSDGREHSALSTRADVMRKVRWYCDDTWVYTSNYPRLKLQHLRGVSFGNFPYLDEGSPGEADYKAGWNDLYYDDWDAGLANSLYGLQESMSEYSRAHMAMNPGRTLAGARRRMLQARGTIDGFVGVSGYQEPSYAAIAYGRQDIAKTVMTESGADVFDADDIATGHTATMFESAHYRVVARMERNFWDRPLETFDGFNSEFPLPNDWDPTTKDPRATVYIYLELKAPHAQEKGPEGPWGEAYNGVDVDLGTLWPFLSYSWDPGRLAGGLGPEDSDEAFANHDVMMEMFRLYKTEKELQDNMLDSLVGSSSGTTPTGVTTTTGGGCFVGGTKISVFDEKGALKYINIEDVRVGDLVVSYNFETGAPEPQRVTETMSPIHDDIVEFEFTDGTITQHTFDHPYYVADKGWVSYTPEETRARYAAPELEDTQLIALGDKMITDTNGETTLSGICRVITGDVQTYTLGVKNNCNYFADGILVHNKAAPTNGGTTSTPSVTVSYGDGDQPWDQGAVEGTALSELISEVFPDLQMGLRLSYLTPAASQREMPDMHSFPGGADASLVELLSGNGTIAGGASTGQDLDQGSLINQYSSFFLYNVGGDDSNQRIFAHLTTDAEATVDLHAALNSQELADALAQGGSVQGFSRFIDELYEEKKVDLCKSLSQNSIITELFGAGGGRPLLDVGRILQYLYISGELKNYYTIFETAPDIFNDTKAVLVMALQAAFAGEDYAATSQCDTPAFQSTAMEGALASLGGMGQSFVNKMLQEAPKNILKGLVELTEPHVIVAKLIREISGQVFQGMQATEQLSNMTQSFNDIMTESNWGPPPGCEGNDLNIDQSVIDASLPQLPVTLEDALQMIQDQIDSHYPEDAPPDMKPQISVKGLDLEGTIPYTFFVPPITPFGILYLLLNLGSWPESMFEKSAGEDCSERSWPPEED